MPRLKFYGVRGSIPVCNKEFQEFGGNTSFILMEGPRRTVIFDAGAGIRDLGKDMAHDPTRGLIANAIRSFPIFIEKRHCRRGMMLIFASCAWFVKMWASSAPSSLHWTKVQYLSPFKSARVTST